MQDNVTEFEPRIAYWIYLLNSAGLHWSVFGTSLAARTYSPLITLFDFLAITLGHLCKAMQHTAIYTALKRTMFR